MIPAAYHPGLPKGLAGWLAAAALAACFAAADLRAQTVTSSHVYQVVADAQAEVLLLLDANFSPTGLPTPPVVAGRQPRHVVQEVHRLLRQLALLRQINGLRTPPVVPLPVREMTPRDGRAWAKRLLSEIRGLRSPFSIEADPAPAELMEGKTPGEVLARLRVLGALIQRLDLPTVVPNDVYRIALAIKADAEQIRTTLGAPLPRQTAPDAVGMGPEEVYARSYDLLTRLKRIVDAQDGLAIPGGIVLPPRKRGRIDSADMLETMLTIRAELSSIKAAVGALEPSPDVPPQVGKTPNDVYLVVEDVIAVLDSLAKAS